MGFTRKTLYGRLMTDITKHDWGKRRDKIIPILEDTIILLEDMSRSFQNDYHINKISHFRSLCYGYILISKYNINTSLLLFRNKKMYQVHYISRNMIEMVINLFYINSDKSERKERVKRFFDYRYVQEYNLLDTLKHFPEEFREFRNKNQEVKTEKNYNKYKSRYKITQKFVTDWSGISLYQRIEKISDEQKRKFLLRFYYLTTRNDNQYVHPSTKYIRSIIDEEFRTGVNDDKNKMVESSLLESIFISVSMIIGIYLEHFQKNRQIFRNKYDELETRFRNIPSKINT
jgi:Family of unknown function (DUF5677)